MGYRQNILNNTTREKAPNHPRHHGVTMQAHHLLSKNGVQKSGLNKDLEHLGYDIDYVKNIVLIPSTLSGACHLNIQVHRGNHGSSKADAADSDGSHKKSYHKLVKELVIKLERNIKKGKYCEASREIVIKAMNIYSRKVATFINNNVAELSSVSNNFGTENTNNKGCCNQTSITKIHDNSLPCLKDRNHTSDGITIPKQDYKLEAGK
jgi:hypothetical protein